MPTHSETKILKYKPEQMFDLVADVNSYPKFLPWCSAARIHSSNMIGKNEVLAMIGPSGCGKSTFLRCFNRMNDTIEICKVEGELYLDLSLIHISEPTRPY